MAERGANTTARGRARREQLLALALDAFAVQGFRGVSTSTIAAAAGISEPGLLHHFPTKRDLLLGVLEHHDDRGAARTRDLVDAGESYCAVVLDIARAHEADPRFIRLFIVLSGESTSPEHPAHEWFARRYERARERFARGFADDQRAGVIDPGLDPQTIARHVIALLDGLELQFLLSAGRQSISKPLAAFLDTLKASEP